MEKRDYIESMVEQLDNSLKKMLSFLIKDTGKENEIEIIAAIDKDFLNEFNMSIDEIILLSPDDFKNKILHLQLKENHIETLSQLFIQMRFLNTRFDFEQKEKLKEKALQLLELANLISNSFSIERLNKKEEILNSK